MTFRANGRKHISTNTMDRHEPRRHPRLQPSNAVVRARALGAPGVPGVITLACS